MFIKKIYVHDTTYLKHDKQIQGDSGVFVYRLNEKNEYNVEILYSYKRNFKDVLEKYHFFEEFIEDKDTQYMMIRYFEIDDEKGKDVNDIYQLSKQQLLSYKEGKIYKPTKQNTINLQEKI